MSNKAGGASKTNQATRYKNNKIWEANRRRKLTKLLEEHPENKQLQIALNDINYRRKTPKTRMWSKSKIREVSLLKLFAKGSNVVVPMMLEKEMFMLKNRI